MEVTDTMIPPPEASAETPVADTAKSDNSTETHYETCMEQELRIQREEEKYAIYISMLSEEMESNTETNTDDTMYSYFN